MKMVILWQLVIVCVAATVAHHRPDHADVDVTYETVSEIIDALGSPDLEPIDVQESTESEETSDGFQKRNQVFVARLRQPVPRRFEPEYPEEPNVPEPPCDDDEQMIEIIEEMEEQPGYVGSMRGTPGVDYPAYTEIPLTSFTCADKKRIPGFYADIETDCQVFHVCYPHRRESFLCPIGTIFNQPILACDYWYSANCSAASCFDIEENLEQETIEEIVEDLVSSVEVEPTETPQIYPEPEMPEVYPEAPEIAVVVEPSDHTFGPVIPKPVEPTHIPLEVDEIDTRPGPVRIQTPDIAAVAKFLPVKAKVVTFGVPLKATLMKAKIAAKPAKAVKIVATKAKVAAAMKAVPIGKIVKAAAVKAVSSKAKLAAPVLAVKGFKAAKFGAAKAKAAKLISVKTRPVISALTKKQLALSLINLMKSQKLRHVGNVGFGAHMYMY